MKVLITGFDPFGGEPTNPAFEAVKLLPDSIAGAEVVKIEIPTVFDKGAAKIIEKMDEINPDVVLSIGQAGGRSMVMVEKVAINLAEARIPDNEGQQPFDEKIKEDGENAYFTTLPAKAMVQEMHAVGLPACISYTAGTYVCNDVMYQVLHETINNRPNVRAGFIHVPFAESQAINKPNGMAYMSLQSIANALEASIKAVVENTEDKAVAMGEIM